MIVTCGRGHSLATTQTPCHCGNPDRRTLLHAPARVKPAANEDRRFDFVRPILATGAPRLDEPREPITRTVEHARIADRAVVAQRTRREAEVRAGVPDRVRELDARLAENDRRWSERAAARERRVGSVRDRRVPPQHRLVR